VKRQADDEEDKQTAREGASEQRKSSDGLVDEAPAELTTTVASESRERMAASAASHIPAAGPSARCDVDSLSVVLSMLSTDDFLAAIRVNKQFYAALLKTSAWPTLQLDSFIQSLRDDD